MLPAMLPAVHSPSEAICDGVLCLLLPGPALTPGRFPALPFLCTEPHFGLLLLLQEHSVKLLL